MNQWEEVLDETKDACRCKIDPPRCPNMGHACFCPGYCQPNPNCPKHGYDTKSLRTVNGYDLKAGVKRIKDNDV